MCTIILSLETEGMDTPISTVHFHIYNTLYLVRKVYAYTDIYYFKKYLLMEFFSIKLQNK